MTLQQSGLTYTPTTEDIAFYQERGWWVSPKIIPDALLDDAVHGAERHYAGERDTPLLISGGFLDWQPSHGDGIRLNDYVSLQNDALRTLVMFPLIGLVAGKLAGAENIRLFHDQLVCKPAGIAEEQSKVGWHVDAAYWRTCSSRNMLTAWIPFQDCDVEMGALSVIEGSHKWEGTEWMRTFNERDLGKTERSLQMANRPLQIVNLRVKRGQVSFHHCRTVHGSLANRSNRHRTALAVHLQDESNHYVRQTDDAGRVVVHINDLLCRKSEDGTPDYGDPDICPELWSARSSVRA